MDGFRVGEDGGEDLLLQGGKVGEAVEENGAAVQKIRLVQQIAQAHLARDGVAAAGFADGQDSSRTAGPAPFTFCASRPSSRAAAACRASGGMQEVSSSSMSAPSWRRKSGRVMTAA